MLLTFSPPAVAAYEAALSFVVNGLWNVEVKVRGEGCELKLELVEPQQQQLALGAVPVYQQAARTVALVNRSRRAIDVSLLDAAAALAPKSVHLSFGGGGALEGELRPRESRALEVRFAPAARIRPFSEPVVVTVCGLPRPLLVVSGACVAMDLQLEMDQVAFGQAVLNSRITRRLMLQNLGDMPSRFNVQGDFAPDFSVSPLEGFLQPNEDVNIEVTFHPAALSRDIRHIGAVTCDGQPPLPLTFTGMCVLASAEPSTLSFKTRVREPSAQSITIKNGTSNLWRITPTLSNDAWQGAEVLEVPAGQSAAYEVSYVPMVRSTLTLTLPLTQPSP